VRQQRLEAFAAGVFQPCQFVKDNALKTRQIRQRLNVIVVRHHDRRRAVKRRLTLRWRPGGDGDLEIRRPLGLLDRPHVRANALGGQHQPPFDVPLSNQLGHGGQRDSRLACAHGGKDHGSVTFEKEISGLFLVRT